MSDIFKKFYYFFFALGGTFFAVVLTEVVFLVAGFFPAGDDFTAGAFLAGVLPAAVFPDLGIGSVLSEVLAGSGGATGGALCFLAASAQFG